MEAEKLYATRGSLTTADMYRIARLARVGDADATEAATTVDADANTDVNAAEPTALRAPDAA